MTMPCSFWKVAWVAPKLSQAERPSVIFSIMRTFAPSSAALRLAMMPPMPAPMTSTSVSAVDTISSSPMVRSSKATGPWGPGHSAWRIGKSDASSPKAWEYGLAVAAASPDAVPSSAKATPAPPSARAPTMPVAPAPLRKSRRDSLLRVIDSLLLAIGILRIFS